MLPPYHLQCCLNLYHPCECRAQNPALRHELSFEMGQVHSDTALHFDDDHNASGSKPVLPREDTSISKVPSVFWHKTI